MPTHLKPFILRFCVYLAFIGNIVLSPQKTFACTCARLYEPTSEEIIQGSDAIFVGKVIGIDNPNPNNTDTEVSVQFQTSRWWKGPGAETIVVTTKSSGATCGSEFLPNREYLVYATKVPFSNVFTTGLCDGNKTLASAETDITELDQAISLKKKFLSPSSNLVSLGIIAGLSLTLFLIKILRLKKSAY